MKNRVYLGIIFTLPAADPVFAQEAIPLDKRNYIALSPQAFPLCSGVSPLASSSYVTPPSATGMNAPLDSCRVHKSSIFVGFAAATAR